MTRIFTDGAESGDLIFFSSTAGGVTTPTSHRSGTYSYYFSNNTRYAYKILPSPISELYVRFAVYIATTFGSAEEHFAWRDVSNNVLGYLVYHSDQSLDLYINGVFTATSTPGTFPITNWHLIETYIKIDDNPNGRTIVKLNGIIVIDYTGDTKPGSGTTIASIYWRGINGGCYIDDIALNDTSGTIDNSWCGDGHIELLSPNGNGDTNDWTNSAGNKTNNYTYVDEIPYTADTDYVSASVVGIQDMYNVGTFTYTNRIIKRVWANSISKDVSYTEKGIKIGYKTGGNVYLSASTVLSGNYSAVSGSVAVVNPATGLEWTGTDIDSIQFVQESA